MTTAHRPTFDPAKGKEALRGPAYHQRLLPAHTQLKYRQPGQGGSADAPSHSRDLAVELLAAEATHFAKKSGHALPSHDDDDSDEEASVATAAGSKRSLKQITSLSGSGSPTPGDAEDPDTKRRRILVQTRDIDADSSSGPSDAEDDDDNPSSSDSSSDEDSDSEDEQEELMRELERVKREKTLKREKEEAERRRQEEDARARDIAMGNPLLNNNNAKPSDFMVKRRWDDDVVFKNQARDADEKNRPKEFVNDMLRSDFHKRFMGKYVR
ncbi:hypothetical protein MKZ38_001253 [Zalerion maritima]|uniref:Pre-mRNA-splicing factor cwc15 n=1 Tax=Zalerion maritima TaxID=339359 RepID=A0AAD5WMZ6_9PEZI|nr:hypothetical protein MKZ38_001253 [Zalerion maritima]